jgi:hypothetical protein
MSTTTVARFDPAHLDDVPAPAHRWLARAIAPGTPLHRRVELTMEGEIRLGDRWQPFHAHQTHVPGERFRWSATAGRFPARINGFDRYEYGVGEMRWKLYGVIPVLTATGPDVTRSAAGRLAGESLLLPTAMVGAPWVTWRSVDDEQAVAEVRIGSETIPVTVHVAPDGRLLRCHQSRWGQVDGKPYGMRTFGVTFDGEWTRHGVSLARRITAGWGWTGDGWEDGPFFRAELLDAAFPS